MGKKRFAAVPDVCDLGLYEGSRRPITVEVPGLPAPIVGSVDVGRISTEDWYRLQAFLDPPEEDEGEGARPVAALIERQEAMAGYLESLGLEWNVTRGGEPVPTDAETLRSLPSVVLNAVFFAAVNAPDPNPPTSTG